MVFIKVLKVSQEGSELAIVAVPEAQGSTSCHQLPAESHAGTDDTGGTVCDMSGSTRCSSRSFLSHSHSYFFTATCPFCPSEGGGMSPITEFCRKMPTNRHI